MKSLKISVSGVRGIVGSALTTGIAFEFGKAFGTFLNCGNVVIARDTRTSGDMLKCATTAGLLSCGCKIVDIGVAPTPTALLYVRKCKADGGIIITASHNPGEWNGLKFAESDGTFLNEERLEKFFDIYYKKEFRAVPWDCLSEIEIDQRAVGVHIGEVLKHLDVAAIRKKHFKVGVDYVNGTGCVITPQFLAELGCKTFPLNDIPNGLFKHEPEPLPKNLKGLCRLVKQKKLDIGFAQDPDADRLAVISDKGAPIGEELTLALAVRFILSYKKKGPIVTNLSASRVLDDIADEFKVRLSRSKVGESNVVSEMKKRGAVIGGEGNGGVIFPKINYGRDSFVGMGLILEYMAKSGKKISQIIKELPHYAMEKKKFECPFSKTSDVLSAMKIVFKNENIDTTDGIKVIRPSSWVHIRSSNTEPIIRVIIEAKTKKEINKLYSIVAKSMGDVMGCYKK